MSSRRSIEARAVGAPPLVATRRVSRFYKPERPALFDVTFDVAQGEFVYIAGASGAGKSTLMRLLHLGEMPDTGKLFYAGHDVAALHRKAISVLRRSMGVVFQDFRLVDDMTVRANVALPLEVAGRSRGEVARRVDEVLEHVGLAGRGADLASDLSGGEQQRAAIARALVGAPTLVLADEPTGSLDAYSANVVLDLLEEVAASGATVILATHDRMLMAARPHRTIAFEGGRMVGMTGPSRREARVAGTDTAVDLERPGGMRAG